MKSKKLFRSIKDDIEAHVSTIGGKYERDGVIPIINSNALILRFKAICDGKSLKEAIKIQQDYMVKK